MTKRFTDEQVIAILRETEPGATPIKALCKKRRPPNKREESRSLTRGSVGGGGRLRLVCCRSYRFRP